VRGFKARLQKQQKTNNKQKKRKKKRYFKNICSPNKWSVKQKKPRVEIKQKNTSLKKKCL